MNNKLGDNSIFEISHLMILISLSLFSIILIGETYLMGWETWIVFVIVVAVLGSWFMHIQNILTSYQRLWIYSVITMFITFFYGTHLTSTYDLAGVVAALIVLSTMTGVKAFINM